MTQTGWNVINITTFANEFGKCVLLKIEDVIGSHDIRILHNKLSVEGDDKPLDLSLIKLSEISDVRYNDSFLLLRPPEIRVCDFDFQPATESKRACYTLNMDRFRAKSRVHQLFSDLMNELRSIIWNTCESPLTTENHASFHIYMDTPIVFVGDVACSFSALQDWPETIVDVTIYPFHHMRKIVAYKIFKISLS